MKSAVVMQSDFGIDNFLVASMHGVCKKIDPTLDTHDITHLIPPFNIVAASRTLYACMTCWPVGTVFVSVVDPGVGTARKACIAKTKNGYYVSTPDNGALTMIELFYGLEEVREIDEATNRYAESEFVSVFHGRDLFSYCAAKLAAGVISFEEVGPAYPLDEVVRHEIPPYEVGEGYAKGVLAGGSKGEDFGIAALSIPNSAFATTGIQVGDWVDISITLEDKTIFDEKVLYGKTFGDVPVGDPVLHNEVACYLGLALNMDNFSAKYGITPGNNYEILIKKA